MNHQLLALVLLGSVLVSACQTTGTAPESKKPVDDPRTLVDLPAQARALMRKDMLDHMAALNEVLAHLSNNDLKAAAVVAESRMGKSSMGKHRASGMGPGRFMPQPMRDIGWGMHDAASEFAAIAKTGNQQAAYKALQELTGYCVACHMSYRTY